MNTLPYIETQVAADLESGKALAFTARAWIDGEPLPPLTILAASAIDAHVRAMEILVGDWQGRPPRSLKLSVAPWE